MVIAGLVKLEEHRLRFPSILSVKDYNSNSNFKLTGSEMLDFLYEEFDKIVYAATLQDSNDNYCPEMITDIDELAKYSKNKIEIVKELHRDKVVKILKERGE